MRSVSGDIRFVRSYPLASFGHVQNFERTPPDKYVRWMNVTHWHAVCPVLVRFVRFSCVWHPVGILYVSVDVRCERSTTGQVTEIPRRVPHAHSVIVQRRFVRFFYGTYSFFFRYTSVTRTLLGRSLSVTCSVRMCSSRLPRRHSPPLRRVPSTYKHFLQIFCPFGVRYLYPFICDSTIRKDRWGIT